MAEGQSEVTPNEEGPVIADRPFLYRHPGGGRDLMRSEAREPPEIPASAGMTGTYRSMHMAMPMPPPMHRVARPFFRSRFCIS
ncbi:hypothetical protein EOD43_07275 [Sphingomonas crocodyli]|uniref:Uncharacterized protein n=1 Tax=Sphingomonas crocodyli TaxID=1979270 RepID=A0A437M7G2_9SPHN|nr:hypothetical protein EOD43_07275 [Sphingomonas crocodyli]